MFVVARAMEDRGSEAVSEFLPLDEGRSTKSRKISSMPFWEVEEVS